MSRLRCTIGGPWTLILSGAVAESDCIVEVDKYTFYDAKDKRVDDGKYILMWTRTADGSGYKQLYDTCSSNIRPE